MVDLKTKNPIWSPTLSEKSIPATVWKRVIGPPFLCRPAHSLVTVYDHVLRFLSVFAMTSPVYSLNEVRRKPCLLTSRLLFNERDLSCHMRYGCETWSLTLREECRLGVLESRVPRMIFGPKRDEVTGE